jgi:adenylate cyclase
MVEHRLGTVKVTYPNGIVVQIPRGLAVLDASRRARIPHASICGGRARCATCRVRVLRGFEHLLEPGPREAAVLSRVHAARTVRLACQIRPTEDTSVLPLLPPDVSFDDRRRRSAGAADVEQFVAIMFLDIRQSTTLVEKRLPYDVIFLLNHFFEAVGGAIAAVGGTPNQFLGDGMMAIFGIDCDEKEACRRAIAATAPIFHRLAEMNRTLAEDLPQPISIGLGLHAGTVILGELGYQQQFILTAIGDTVHVAARLQELTKEFGCQAVVSHVVLATAGGASPELPRRDVRVRGREAELTVGIVSDVNELLVGRQID